MKTTTRLSNVLAVLIAITAGSTNPALSKGADQGEKDWQTCMDKSDGSNAAWGGCGQVWLKQEDDKLNEVWKKVYDQATGQTKTDLLSEQRLWNTYKEGSCQLYANGEWGAERTVLDYVSCRAEVIDRRITDLESYGELFKGN
ncbi:lysozyme inhibitor LprI family protein [Rhizobium herbae]|jgi:uncharacterized protein YecT (DUF1311 family)